MMERSVRQGAQHLDRVHPGWEREIDLNDFCIGTYDRCVLGQLHAGGYQQGIAALGLSARQACECGFDLLPLARWPSWRVFATRSGFDYLNECWKRLILERRRLA
jgi:hypothetical protein